jgi:hypothetical protein
MGDDSLLLLNQPKQPTPFVFLLRLYFLLFGIFVMKFISSSTVALAVLLAGKVHAATYKLNDTFEGNQFFSGFAFLTQSDPLKGRV